jgi:3-dehydroquinate synthase
MIWSRRLSGTRSPSLVLGGPGALDRLPEQAANAARVGSRLFVFTDENVSAVWGLPILRLMGGAAHVDDVFVVPPGETSKSVTRLLECWDWLAARGARRNDIVVALGGGVVGDLAGFSAATYLRGLSLWQIPTTLLAQVDSSVGGKTGVNLEAGKNLVGSFYQPELVIADPATLATLPENEYVGGLGEVVKYGLLLGEDLFRVLEANSGAVTARDQEILGDLVHRCVEYKADVVDEDELDQGRRAVLNLGHTAAHALERTLGYGAISHGRAVALGLLVATELSEGLLGLDPKVRVRTRGLLETLGLPVSVELPPVESLVAAASRDKKVIAGTTGFVGLAAIGAPVWGVDVPSSRFAQALEVIRV